MAAVVAQTAPAEVTAVAAATTAATRPAAAVTMAAMVAVAASAAAAAAGATATTAAAAPKGWLVVVQPAAHVSARPLRVPCWQKRSAMSPTTGCLVAAAARRPPALSTAARRLKRSCPAFAYSLRGNLSRRQAARQSRQLLPPLLLGLQLGLHMWWLMVVLAPLGVPMPGWRTQTVQAKRRRPCSQPIHRTGPAPAFASWILKERVHERTRGSSHLNRPRLVHPSDGSLLEAKTIHSANGLLEARTIQSASEVLEAWTADSASGLLEA
uniref:Uncharacterized protein n=1 Tax=Chlamydomonas euryale TaxID=1486919 RepID=A0A7R9VFL8_9CHLO|mmetsp:Transcript_3423/g.9550  ORF Transcript_3423/g.9550 Transcript_3423/m.9550 type:complete len:268 (+) Transcript_3423:2243-3046(+)